MKLYLGSTPVTTYVHTDTDDATLMSSANMQSGMTAYVKGVKVTGIGKCFRFATYGSLNTNTKTYVPSDVNVLLVSARNNNVHMAYTLLELVKAPLKYGGSALTIGTVSGGNSDYAITATIDSNGMLTLACSLTVTLQVFYGKDINV